MKNQLIITITVLSLILMSTISVQASCTPMACMLHCAPFPGFCILGGCICKLSKAEKPRLPIQKCATNCDCHNECGTFGHKICHKNICGCLSHPYYQQPICTSN